jgi:hypothetical protein
MAELVADLEAEGANRHRQEGTVPLGIAGVLAQNPHPRPRRSKWSPALIRAPQAE